MANIRLSKANYDKLNAMRRPEPGKDKKFESFDSVLSRILVNTDKVN